jgi:hypothetical protein
VGAAAGFGVAGSPRYAAPEHIITPLCAQSECCLLVSYLLFRRVGRNPSLQTPAC